MGVQTTLAAKGKRRAEDEEFLATIMGGLESSSRSREQLEHEFAARMRGWAERKALQEAAVRDRHQEQFYHLRARLKGLEMEASITSAPVTALRRKQQSLLAGKHYAEAFDHMKVVKRAEKEAMRAHREEQRRVNEESVRHLLESQAKEREHFKQTMKTEEDSLKEFKFKCMASLSSQDTDGEVKPTQQSESRNAFPFRVSTTAGDGGQLPFSGGQTTTSPGIHHHQQQSVSVPRDLEENFAASSLLPPDGNVHWQHGQGQALQGQASQSYAPQGEQQQHGAFHANPNNATSNAYAPHQHQATDGGGMEGHGFNGYGGYPHEPPQSVPGGGAGGLPSYSSYGGFSSQNHDRWGQTTATPQYNSAMVRDSSGWMSSVPQPLQSGALAQQNSQQFRSSTFGASHGGATADLRPIPSSWQAGAINARPGSSFESSFDGGRGGGRRDEKSLENAATVLLNAALTLVGHGGGGGNDLLRAGGDDNNNEGQPGAQGHGQGQGAPWQGQPGAPHAHRQHAHAHAAMAHGAFNGSLVDERGEPIVGDERAMAEEGQGHRSFAQAGQHVRGIVRSFGIGGASHPMARGDEHENNATGGGNRHANAANNSTSDVMEESGSEDDDDAPLALPDAAPRGIGGRAVPGIDFSKMSSLKAKPMTRASIIKQDNQSAPSESTAAAGTGKGGRGLQKFGNAARKVENTLSMFRGLGGGAGRGERPPQGAAQGREEETSQLQLQHRGADQQRAEGALPPRDEASNQIRKIAAAKLLMKRAGNVPRLQSGHGDAHASAQENLQPPQSSQPKQLARVEAVNEPPPKQSLSHVVQQPSITAAVQVRKATDKMQQESRMVESQKRQFTTDDFRNLFSYARHGKYKQVTELLKNGCPAEGRDQFGNSPLIIACQNGNARIVKALLRHSANIDSQNKQGCTGLHYCIAYGFNALSDYLIAKGANDKLLNKMGLSPYEGIK
jgi:hypothetical protein